MKRDGVERGRHANSQIANNAVLAIAYTRGKVYAGGTFTDAGGNANADFLAVWDGRAGRRSAPPSPARLFDGNVRALQVVGATLYVGGEFQDGAGIGDADYLVACNLNNGAASPTLPPGTFPSGPVLALTADSNGVLYAGGRFLDLAGAAGAPDPAADNVAYLANGSWHAMGSGVGNCSCALDGFVRSLTASGTDVYVGTDVSRRRGHRAGRPRRALERLGVARGRQRRHRRRRVVPEVGVHLRAGERRVEALRDRRLHGRGRRSDGR